MSCNSLFTVRHLAISAIFYHCTISNRLWWMWLQRFCIFEKTANLKQIWSKSEANLMSFTLYWASRISWYHKSRIRVIYCCVCDYRDKVIAITFCIYEKQLFRSKTNFKRSHLAHYWSYSKSLKTEMFTKNSSSIFDARASKFSFLVSKIRVSGSPDRSLILNYHSF